MRTRLLIGAVLASTIAACGSSSNSGQVSTTAVTLSPSSVSGSPAKQAKSATPGAGTSTTHAAAPKLEATYVAPQRTLKTPSGKAPAVVLLPDTGNRASADGEARRLAQLGIGALVVAGPANAPTQADAFNTAVAATLQAVKKLRSEPGVDPTRIGIVGEGVGAHVGAVAIGRDPRSITAAALADIGGVVVPSPSFAPERWLRRAIGIELLFQRDEAKRAMTKAEIRRLMLASPPGTLMEQYKNLGTTAQAARDSWIKQKLLAG
jgi:outer membrane lipoprotein SlyB